MYTKIGEIRGYKLAYNTKDRLFHLLDSDNESVASAKTQEEVEAQAANLSKQKFSLPIQALTTSGVRFLQSGRITSVNPSPQECSVRFVPDDQRYEAHVKLKLRYSHIYEATEHNQQIAAEIKARENKMTELETEIRELLKQLEKPIGPEYFKIPKPW